MKPTQTILVQTTAENRRALSLIVAVAAAILLVGHAIETRPQTVPDSVLQCVPCHRSGDSDQVGEWMASPYSAQQAGLGCLDCHHHPCFGNRDSGPADRTWSTTPLEQLRDTARLAVTAIQESGAVDAEVAVANVGAGHLLPSGSADRILVLEVTASDHAGKWLLQRSGPEIPDFGGVAAGAPGRIYVREPTGGYSNDVRPRLAPFATDVSRYRFSPPTDGPTMVTARLLLIRSANPPMEIANTAVLCGPSSKSR